MEIRIEFVEDPVLVLSKAGEFLASQSVLHNLILSLLHARAAQPEPGRYWVAMERDRVVGVVLQSPMTFAATLTPMDPRVTAAIVEAIATTDVSLPRGEWRGRNSSQFRWTLERTTEIRGDAVSG
jgi:hypothetical protein